MRRPIFGKKTIKIKSGIWRFFFLSFHGDRFQNEKKLKRAGKHTFQIKIACIIIRKIKWTILASSYHCSKVQAVSILTRWNHSLITGTLASERWFYRQNLWPNKNEFPTPKQIKLPISVALQTPFTFRTYEYQNVVDKVEFIAIFEGVWMTCEWRHCFVCTSEFCVHFREGPYQT